MRLSKVIFCLVGAIVLICCLTSKSASQAFKINYNKSNFTCGNISCYGPFTTCNETETLDKPCCNETLDNPCECKVGFEGDGCRFETDECGPGHRPCGTTGLCNNTIGSFWCICLRGWMGEHCNIETGDPKECINGWTGPKCHDDINECQNPDACGTHHRCINGRGNYTCVCDYGWTEQNCTTDIDECLSTPCKHNGNCTNTQGSFVCGCPLGWVGQLCEIDVDECSQNASICMQGSTCTNNDGSYICNCISGFEGRFCENDIDECRMEPCLNDGTCNNTIGSFNCACAEHFNGTNCEKDLSANSGNGADNTPVIVGSVLGSVGAVGAAVSGVFLFKKFSRWRCNKTHSEFSSDGLNRDQKAEETPTMPGQTKFHVT